MTIAEIQTEDDGSYQAEGRHGDEKGSDSSHVLKVDLIRFPIGLVLQYEKGMSQE